MSFEFLEFIAGLSESMQEALPFLRSAAETAKSVSSIVREARELGFSGRTQTMRDVVNAYRGKIVTPEAINRQTRVLGSGTVLHPSSYGVSKGRLLRSFSYKVARTIRGIDSGEHDAGFVTISSSKALSEQQIFDEARQFTTGACNPLFEEVEIVSLRLDSALRSPEYVV